MGRPGTGDAEEAAEGTALAVAGDGLRLGDCRHLWTNRRNEKNLATFFFRCDQQNKVAAASKRKKTIYLLFHASLG